MAIKVCARCERVFLFEGAEGGCPKCGFAFYPNAEWVYASRLKAVIHLIFQAPYKEKLRWKKWSIEQKQGGENEARR